jgi:hypothetical protein
MVQSVEAVSTSLAAGSPYGLRAGLRLAIMVLPVVAMLLMVLMLLDPASESTARWMLEENHPIEMLTFVFLFAGGVLGLFLAGRARQRGESTLVCNFYLVFALGLLFAGMEEIAWGQQLLGFETPAFLKGLNRQGETTLHNLRGLNGRTELLRLAFGCGGILGVYLSAGRFRRLAAPRLLLPWFVVIAAHAGIDYYADLVRIEHDFDFLIRHTSELVELLIGAAGFLYVFLHWARLSDEGGRA